MNRMNQLSSHLCYQHVGIHILTVLKEHSIKTKLEYVNESEKDTFKILTKQGFTVRLR